VAVNVDTVESDLTAADVPPLFEHLTQWQDLALSTTNPIVRRQVFQVYLLVAALLVLLLETVLAWRFGTRGA
jgi:hypothetical protein